MAQVSYGGPILPPNLPGIPQGGYGTPGINPNAPDPRTGRPPQTALEKFIGDALRRVTIFGPGGVFASPAPGQTPEATKRAEEAIQSDRQAQAEGEPFKQGFCFGFDQTLCKDAGLFKASCLTFTNLTCLALGVIVLLALLGIGLTSIVK